jgi:glycine/D-amino acid oxidase-like deaminating enzyme/nitrite reductase/ring-hydroxylating ferredoxin subunit
MPNLVWHETCLCDIQKACDPSRLDTHMMSNATTAHTESVWMATSHLRARPPLRDDVTADVCVVGAGVAGMTTAYLLSLKGYRVIVIDDGPIASGETQRTTAHLANALDAGYVEIERLHGPDGARLAAESHTAAIDRIEQIVRNEKIECDFERLDGYLFSPDGESFDLLEREFEAARRTGVVAIERVPRAPLEFFDTGPCLRFLNQAQCHPLAYLAGLAQAVEREGGQIANHVHADSIVGGSAARVETRDGPVIRCTAIVVATNTPINDRVAIHTKQAAYLTYVVGLRVPHGAIPRALFWDTEDPFHYVRLQPLTSREPFEQEHDRYDLLIVGGEDHKTGQAADGEERFRRLEAWARLRFPQAQQLEYEWSGQVMASVDRLAYIGRNPLDDDNVYISTGDSGQGMTHGTIAGMMLAELISGNEHPWSRLYDPARKPIRAAATYASENLNVAKQFGDWLTSGDVESEEHIFAGCGAVIRDGLAKIAVYRDPNGRLVRCSAVCPHLKCIVNWNAVEHTWDCPCHGSRFDPYGVVLNGPANRNLDPVENKE